MGNASSGLGLRGSRDNLNEDASGDDVRARSKKVTSDSSLGVPEQRASQQDSAVYDMPSWEGTGTADAERRDSLGLATAASSKAGVTPASAPGLRRGSAPAAAGGSSSKPESEGATTAESGLRSAFWSNRSKKKPKKEKKDATVGLQPSDPGTAGAASAAAVAADLQMQGRLQLVARSNSKEASSKGPVSAGGVRVLPVLPPKPAVARSASEDKAGSQDAATLEDEEDNYDHIQRDLRPSKIKSDMLLRPERQAAGSSSGGSGGSGGKVSQLQPLQGGSSANMASLYDSIVLDAGAVDRGSTTYESVYPDSLVQSAEIKSGMPGKVASGPALPQLAAAATTADNAGDNDGLYDCIQRDVNPMREKQLRMQADSVYGGSSGTNKGRQVAAPGILHSPGSSAGSVQPLAASVSREGYAVRCDDGNDNEYDRIQHDVNPMKMKQGRAPPAVEYSLPQARQVMPRDVSMAYETVDTYSSGSSSTAAPASISSSTAAVGGARVRAMPPVPAHASIAGSVDDEGGDDSDGGQYATISVSAAQPNIASHGSSSAAGSGSVGTATAASRPRAAAPPPSPAATSTASTLASFGRQPTATTAAGGAAPQNGGAQPARAGALYSEVKPTNSQRPPAATSVASALLAARSPPPSVPPKQFSFSSSGADFDVGDVTTTDKHGSSPTNERRDHDNRTKGPALQAATVDTSPADADADQRRQRVNQIPHYENVSVDPNRADAIAESFDSRSACYANDQSLRGSQQPPMLTASPPLARNAATGSAAARDRTKKNVELAPPRLTAPAAELTPSQRNQPKLHPANEAASMYSEIDFAVGAPVQPSGTATPSPTQQRQTAHAHSTQDGLLVHEAGQASPAQLSAPRKKPWVMQNTYQDVDDVREGLA